VSTQKEKKCPRKRKRKVPSVDMPQADVKGMKKVPTKDCSVVCVFANLRLFPVVIVRLVIDRLGARLRARGTSRLVTALAILVPVGISGCTALGGGVISGELGAAAVTLVVPVPVVGAATSARRVLHSGRTSVGKAAFAWLIIEMIFFAS